MIFDHFFRMRSLGDEVCGSISFSFARWQDQKASHLQNGQTFWSVEEKWIVKTSLSQLIFFIILVVGMK